MLRVLCLGPLCEVEAEWAFVRCSGALGEASGTWQLQRHTWGRCSVLIRACGNVCPCVSEVSLLSSCVWGRGAVEQTPCVNECLPIGSVVFGSTVGFVLGNPCAGVGQELCGTLKEEQPDTWTRETMG